MDATFWHQRWEANEIGFHQATTNAHLVTYFTDLVPAKGSRVFVPLCGKTLDIAWLLSQGYRVAGAELSELAIRQLFVELDLQPELSIIGKVTHYHATNIDIFVGNIFDLTNEVLGFVNATFDRAALVALPEPTRVDYASHIIGITNHAPQLLITYEYDQTLLKGPPFSIPHKEIRQHYSADYDISLLRSGDVIGGLKGLYEAKENIWHLKP